MNFADSFTRISRFISWHRRGLGVLAAVICLFACLNVLNPAQPESAPVLVAARSLPAGGTLSDADLNVIEMPVAFIPEAALSQHSQATGRILTGAVSAGSVLTANSVLTGREATDPDERLVPFRVPDAATVALLQVGDRISVVGSSVDGGVIDLATDVRIAALPTPASGSSLGSTESGALVVVAANQQTAARLAAASNQMRMAIVLR